MIRERENHFIEIGTDITRELFQIDGLRNESDRIRCNDSDENGGGYEIKM